MTWYAIYVNSRSEKKVVELLKAKYIEAYAPIIKTMRQWSDRKKMVEIPLLNGYVFVKINAVDKDKVLQTKGVVNYVRYCGAIAIIKEVEINRLKQLVDLGYQLQVNAPQAKYAEGDKIKITSGPLKNMEGYVLENKQGKFIDILLESIGLSIKVKLSEEILLPI
jgi:transcription antitermination factor NusG